MTTTIQYIQLVLKALHILEGDRVTEVTGVTFGKNRSHITTDLEHTEHNERHIIRKQVRHVPSSISAQAVRSSSSSSFRRAHSEVLFIPSDT